jgi:hypothetical protein
MVFSNFFYFNYFGLMNVFQLSFLICFFILIKFLS